MSAPVNIFQGISHRKLKHAHADLSKYINIDNQKGIFKKEKMLKRAEE
jgi:hypothetical protein